MKKHYKDKEGIVFVVENKDFHDTYKRSKTKDELDNEIKELRERIKDQNERIKKLENRTIN